MPPRKKKTPGSGSANTNDEPERSETPEVPGTHDEDEEHPSDEDEPTPTSAELLKLFHEMRTELQNKDRIIEFLDRERNVAEPREPRVSEPTEFHGKISEYSTFISQCLLTFTLCPRTYSKPEQKVLFVIAYLRGNARSWAERILENNDHPFLKNFDAFKEALDSLYLDRNLKHQARDKLFALKQTKSASSYAVDFQQIIVPLKLDDEAKCLLFYNGLKPTLKDALALVGEEEKFKELVDQVIDIDQRQFHRLQEEKKASAPPSKTPEPPPKPSGLKRPNTPGPSSGPPPKKHASFQRGPLSEEEKQRRRDNNLCVYCADPYHKTSDCPRIAKKASNVEFEPDYLNPDQPPKNWPSQATMRPVP
jgi:Retrotransposon gag protein